MFTGIIQGLCEVVEIEHKTNLNCLYIDLGELAGDLALGASVAINGTCLTVTGMHANRSVAGFDVIKESLALTNLGALVQGSRVNIERSLKFGDEIGGRYVLRSELGKGGMGRVFLARDMTLDRDVALKVELRREKNANEKIIYPDLAREAKLAALLKHANIASVYDFGIHAAKPFTIFEYVDGNNLRQGHAATRQVDRGGYAVAD